MGREELIDDERTGNVLKRKQHEDFVVGVVSDWTHTRSKAQVVEALGGQVPCGPVNTANDLFNDPHCAVREMIAEIDLPGGGGSAEIVGHPIKFTNTPSGVYRRPPTLGEHIDEVYAQFGLKPAPNHPAG
jgi:crotonobetainyl-CoA:carnitine CoA-transferase CaiB-like acyl-CoA transferase